MLLSTSPGNFFSSSHFSAITIIVSQRELGEVLRITFGSNCKLRLKSFEVCEGFITKLSDGMACGKADVWQFALLLIVLIMGNESPVSILFVEVN